MSGPSPGREVLVVTGMSGAGRARRRSAGGPRLVRRRQPAARAAAHAWSSWPGAARAAVPRVAAVVDVRGRAFFGDLRRHGDAASARAPTSALLFLEAADEVLVRRFEKVRRPHPLQGDGTLLDGIAARARAAPRAARRRRPGHRHLAASTCTSCARRSRRPSVDAGPPVVARHRDVVRLQVRPAAGRRHRRRRAASCPTRTGSPSCGRTPGSTRGPRLRAGQPDAEEFLEPVRGGAASW